MFMKKVTYKIETELKNPWWSVAYVEYQLVKMWSEFVMDWPDHHGDDRNFQKVIFKSVNKTDVEVLIKQLENK